MRKSIALKAESGPFAVQGRGSQVAHGVKRLLNVTLGINGRALQPLDRNGSGHANGHVTGAVEAGSTSLVASADADYALDLTSPAARSSTSSAGPTQRIYDLLHTVLDPVLAAFGLILLALPLAVLALIVKLDSPGPVLFRQHRVGKDGELFEILKFRTMHLTAPKYSLKVRSGDTRVTSIGRILRSTGLDEVPQLWNVLRGHMRLIGPRPEQPFIAERYAPQERARLHVPPGITGWWQVHNRDEVPMHLNVHFDLYHIENRSLWLDLQIVMLTLRVLVNGFRRRSHLVPVALDSGHSGLAESTSSD